jgi:hypothetical protein
LIGRESWVKGKRIVWGLVRPAKDSLRMNNYWMSALTEKIGLAPKVPFIGAEGQFEGHESAWKAANRENRAYLEYKPIDVNGNALPQPQRVAPAPLEVAMVNMTALIERDVKAALGMYKAAVGDTDSQQSGRAILALQKESDTGTFHFADNLNRSIRHCGRILIDLIPKIYDTRRVLRILGEDDEPQSVTVDPEQQQARLSITDPTGRPIKTIYNLGVGKYDVTVSVGPSYTTARQEAATILTELANSAKDPTSAAVMRYLAVKNSDFFDSDEAMRMLKALLPPALQQDPKETGLPPHAAAALEQATMALQQANAKIQELESGQQAAMAKVQVQQQEGQAKIQLEREKAEAEAKLALAKARLDAQVKLQTAQIDADCKMKVAGLQSDTDMSIAFMGGQNEKAIAEADRAADIEKADADREVEVQTSDKDRVADLLTSSADRSADMVNADADREAQMQMAEGEAKPAKPQAGGNLRDMMTMMMTVMDELAKSNQQMMQQHEEHMAQIAQALTKNQTKHVTMKAPSGQTYSATIN